MVIILQGAHLAIEIFTGVTDLTYANLFTITYLHSPTELKIGDNSSCGTDIKLKQPLKLVILVGSSAVGSR